MKVQRLIPPKTGCWKAGLIPKLLLELAICSTVSPPGINATFSGVDNGGTYTYSLDSLFIVIALIKSYLILRIYWHYCSWNTNAAIRIGRRHSQKLDLLFAIKADLKYRPFLVIGVGMVISIFYLGFIIRTAELSYIDKYGNGSTTKFQPLLNSAWLVIITMCTVGYGDIYPKTFLGRFFAVITFIVGNVLISLIVVVLSSETNFEPPEAKAYNTLKKEMASERTKGQAANVIRTAMRLLKAKVKRDGRSFSLRFVYYSHLKQQIKQFKTVSKQANSHTLPATTLI